MEDAWKRVQRYCPKMLVKNHGLLWYEVKITFNTSKGSEEKTDGVLTVGVSMCSDKISWFF